MKHQYVGDLNDYRKYALLRVLAAGGANRIGVCWMLTPPDGRSDGSNRGYLARPERYRHFDPELFDVLRRADARIGGPDLAAIEAADTVPGAIYFNEMLPRPERDRLGYMARCRAALAEADLVFFDPDNGVEVASKQRGRAGSERYVFLDELGSFYARGQSIMVYQHFGRVERTSFIRDAAERLATISPAADIRAFRTGNVLFLLALHPSAKAGLRQAVDQAASRWIGQNFLFEHTVDSQSDHLMG